MNKLFNKIAVAFVGIAMAVGVGVAVGTKQSVVPAEAISNGDYFKKVTSLSDLVDGDEVIITNSGGTVALSTTQNNNNRGQASISGSSGLFQYSTTTHSSVQILTLKKYNIDSKDYYAFHTGTGFLYSPSANNYLKTDTNGVDTSVSAVQNYTWTLSVSEGVFTINCAGRTAYYLQYNSSNTIFSCYKNTQANPSIYKKAHSVTYNGNGKDGGTDVSDSNSPYLSGSTVTVKSNTWTKTGFVFSHWDTKADDAGTDYSPAGTFTISENTTLYAIWESAGSDPYVNLSLTSGDAPYTGETVTISASSGNLEGSGLTWTVEAGTVTNESKSNTSYSAKLASTGTVTIRATDNGGSTYDEVSVTVTKNAITGLVSSKTIIEGDEFNLGDGVAAYAGAITWTSSDNDVVSVDSDGVITGEGQGSVTVTATSIDTTVTATCAVTVTEAPTYTKITSVSQLWPGQKVLITNSDGAYMAKAWESGNNLKLGSATPSENVISYSDSKKGCVFTLGQVVYDSNGDDVLDATAWTFKEGNNYLYAASTSANHLKSKTTLALDCYFGITIDESGNVSITCKDTTKYGVMQYNSSASCISCYQTASQGAVTLFVEDSDITGASACTAFANEFLHMSDYDSNLDTKGQEVVSPYGQCSTYYPIAKVAWNNLSSDLRTYFIDNSDESETYHDAYERMIAWAAANGESLNGSNVLASAHASLLSGSINASNNVTIIIVVVSLASIIAIGGYLFLRTKKED